MLQQYMNLSAVGEERANAFDFLEVQRVEELYRAKLLKDIGQLEMAKQWIRGLFMAVTVGSQRNDGDPLVQTSEQLADVFLMVWVADKHDRLVDIVQFDLLVGLWFEQIALPDLAALAFNGPGHFFVGDGEANT